MLLLRRGANFLKKTLFPVSLRIGYLGISVIMAMVLLIVADVTLRRVFNSPLPFSFELVGVMLVVIVFCSVPYSTSISRHVSIEVLTSRFPPKARTIIDAVTDFLCAAVFGVIAWQCIVRAMHFWDIGQQTGILKVPYYPFLFVVAFGTIFAGFALLVGLINLIIGEARK